MPLTQTEENYLKAIFTIADRDDLPIRTNDIAKLLSTKASSVTDMLKKLAEKDLILYERYKPITLSESGKEVATHLIRKHRLWETFLVENLGFNWSEVHHIAEQLEHIRAPELVQRLADYLDNPLYDPHGDPIPDASGHFPQREQVLLGTLKPGECGRLCSVVEDDASFLEVLNMLEIKIGTLLEIEGIISFDDTMQVRIGQKQSKILSNKICNNLFVIQA